MDFGGVPLEAWSGGDCIKLIREESSEKLEHLSKFVAINTCGNEVRSVSLSWGCPEVCRQGVTPKCPKACEGDVINRVWNMNMYPGERFQVDAIALAVIKDDLKCKMPVKKTRKGWFSAKKEGDKCVLSISEELWKSGWVLNVTQTAPRASVPGTEK